MNFSSRTHIVTALVLLVLLSLLGGCKEKDVPYVIDEDVIANYVAQVEKARDLFRVDSLIVSNTYQTPIDDAVYYDSLLSRGREMTVTVVDEEQDYAELGWMKEAFVEVVDTLHLRTFRTVGTETSSFDRIWYLKRTGFFLKLGSDSQPYVGWDLWGFAASPSSSSPVDVTVTPQGGPSFSGKSGLYMDTAKSANVLYVRLSEIPEVPNGSDLLIQTVNYNTQSPIRYYQLLTLPTDTGYTALPLPRDDRVSSTGTFQMPAANPRLYDLVMIQCIDDSTGVLSGSAWVFPFKVPQ